MGERGGGYAIMPSALSAGPTDHRTIYYVGMFGGIAATALVFMYKPDTK